MLRGTHPTAGAAQETQPAVGPHTVQFFDEQAVGTESARVDLPRFVPNVLPKPLRRGSHCVVSPHKSGLGQTRQRDTQRDTRLRRLWKTMSTASRHRPRSLRSTSPNSWQRDSGPCKDAQGHLNELELLVAFRENAFRENAPSLVQACCGARIRQREQRKKHSQQLGHTQFNSSTNKLSVLRARESICQ